MDTIKKRSVMIRGHRTAVSIEDAFWKEIKRLARVRGGVALLIADVDANRTGRSLSSSLRLAVLDDLTHQNAQLLDIARRMQERAAVAVATAAE